MHALPKGPASYNVSVYRIVFNRRPIDIIAVNNASAKHKFRFAFAHVDQMILFCFRKDKRIVLTVDNTRFGRNQNINGTKCDKYPHADTRIGVGNAYNARFRLHIQN